MINSNSEVNLILQSDNIERKSISLIPSENFMSPLACSMYSTRISNTYLLPLEINDKYLTPGRNKLEEIITNLTEKLEKKFKNDNAYIKCLSGLHQMETIFLAFKDEIKDCIILDPKHGGHSSTKYLAERLGYNINYSCINYTTWDFDYESIYKLIKKLKNKKVLFYIDHTVVLKPLEMKKLIDITPKEWIIYYDISHLMLFYFTKIYKFPKQENFFFGGSTHKSFPGPQKAMLFCQTGNIQKKIEKVLFSSISNYHLGSALALDITFEEMNYFGKEYAQKILDNSKQLAKQLSKSIEVSGPLPKYTQTHQVCALSKNPNLDCLNLSKINIITTPMRVPSKNCIGFRFGTQAITRLGMQKKEINKITKNIISTITFGPSKSNIEEIIELTNKFKEIKYCFKLKD